MAVNLSALAGAGQQFFDDSGNVLTGGKLYSYQAGTTTPQTTYTDATGTIAHSNPIILNASGRVSTGEIWLTAGNNYKFVLNTSDNVLIATWDNITGINGTGITTSASSVSFTGFKGQSGTVQDLADDDGSDWIGFDQTGAGSVARSAQDKMRDAVSVKDFGAVGDGITDDSIAIQAAIDTGRNVFVPSGNYRLESTIAFNTTKQIVVFDGQSQLLAAHNATSAIEINAEWVTFYDIRIGNAAGFNSSYANGVAQFITVKKWYFTMRGGIVGGTGIGQYATGVFFTGFSPGPPMLGSFVSTLDGVRFAGADSTTGHTAVHYGTEANQQRLHNCYITNYANGVAILGGWPGWSCLATAFEANEIAINFHPTSRSADGLVSGKIDTCYFENNTAALYFGFGDTYNLTVNNNYCSGKGAGSYFLQISDGAGAGRLEKFSFDCNWVQNVETVFNMGTSIIQKNFWKVSRIRTSSITNYATGWFTNQVMEYNDPPVIRNWLTSGGPYPVTTTITARDNNNIFTNADAGGELRYQLPTIGSNYYDLAYEGMTLTFIRNAGYSMKVYPASGQFVGAGGASKYLELQANNSTVTVVGTANGRWQIVGSNGTIGYEP